MKKEPIRQIAVCSECHTWVLVQPQNRKGVLYFQCPICAARVPASSWWPAPAPHEPEVQTWIPVRLEKVVGSPSEGRP